MGCLKITENTGAIRLGKNHFFLGDTYEKKEVPQNFCNDYYPFGLSFNSYARAAITDQNFKFNAGSELESMTDWYSTPFRKYDPSLGRFHGVDALASMYSSWSPSQFAGNNPINYNDPTGLHWDDPDGDDASPTGGSGGGWGQRASIFDNHWSNGIIAAAHEYHNNSYLAKQINHFLDKSFSIPIERSHYNLVTGEMSYGQNLGLESKSPNMFMSMPDMQVPYFGGSESLIVGLGANGGTGAYAARHTAGLRSSGLGGGRMGMDPDFNGTGGDDIDGDYYDGGTASNQQNPFDWNTLANIVKATFGNFQLGLSISIYGPRTTGYYNPVWRGMVASGKSVSAKAGILGLAITGVEILEGGRVTTTNAIDATVGTISFAGVPGAIISGTYFTTNIVVQGATGKGIGQHIDDNYYIIPSGNPSSPFMFIPK